MPGQMPSLAQSRMMPGAMVSWMPRQRLIVLRLLTPVGENAGVLDCCVIGLQACAVGENVTLVPRCEIASKNVIEPEREDVGEGY